MHYNDVPTSTKTWQMLAGLAPPVVGWYKTGSIQTAGLIFVIGFIGGQIITSIYGSYLRNTIRWDQDGNAFPEDALRIQMRLMPVFLWAGPVCGAVAAAYFGWYRGH
jgi:hypothetical protein